MDKYKKTKDQLEREAQILADPMLLDVICDHVANGGTLIELAKTFDVTHALLIRWIRKDKDRSKRYDQARLDRDEWSIERILQELRTIGYVDLREAYDERGALKPMHELPETLARAIAGVDVVEEYQTIDGKPEHIGSTKKLKLIDKLKALELMGKQLRMFIDRHETSTVVSLADLVMESMKPEGGADAKE